MLLNLYAASFAYKWTNFSPQVHVGRSSLFNPENNQLIGENNGKQQQTTNQVSTETEAN
ncbi:hypothetical protein SHM_27670 [Spiroplasma ixodetis]|uniref:Uncharacterized protein n=1 Tax=Spiroplasma ixodetis TaxID=2141 RepID=A0ABM8BZ06_9MOLU|nr:hypothetical protein SHM_27670 [Spiroplasma ixodetis]